MTPQHECRCGYQLLDGQTCPECGLQFAEAIARSGESKASIGALIALIISVVGTPGFMCACGHLHLIAFITTVPAASMAWLAFTVGRPRHSIGRALIMLAVIVTSGLLLKNIADVLWFGHDPLMQW